MGFGRRRQFAGELDGTAANNPRTYGDKTGMVAEVGGWKGMIRTRVWYDHVQECDRFETYIVPHWKDSGSGKRVLLASGILNHEITDPFIVPSIFA